MFFAYVDVSLGAAKHEVPFGRLVGDVSYATLDAFFTGYGDIAAFGGRAPAQDEMYREGLRYLEPNFPELDYITQCWVDDGAPGGDAPPAPAPFDDNDADDAALAAR